MTNPARNAVQPIDNYLTAPVIYCDAIPTSQIRGGVLSLTLATHVGEPITTTNTTDHLLAVANLRLTAATAAQLRDVIDKLLLAAQPVSGGTN